MAPRTPFRSPGAFFRESPDWIRSVPALLALAAAPVVLVALSFRLTGLLVEAATGVAAGGFRPVGYTFAALTLVGFVVALLDFGAWFLYHDARGSAADLFEVAAWGMVVYALAWSAVAVLLGVAVGLGSPFPASATVGDVGAALGDFRFVAAPVVLLAGVWAWIVWYCGIRYRHQIQDGLAVKATSSSLALVLAPSLVFFVA